MSCVQRNWEQRPVKKCVYILHFFYYFRVYHYQAEIVAAALVVCIHHNIIFIRGLVFIWKKITRESWWLWLLCVHSRRELSIAVTLMIIVNDDDDDGSPLSTWVSYYKGSSSRPITFLSCVLEWILSEKRENNRETVHHTTGTSTPEKLLFSSVLYSLAWWLYFLLFCCYYDYDLQPRYIIPVQNFSVDYAWAAAAAN